MTTGSKVTLSATQTDPQSPQIVNRLSPVYQLLFAFQALLAIQTHVLSLCTDVNCPPPYIQVAYVWGIVK